MYVCSLHEKECPCRLCSIARVTVTCGCAFQVTVSTSNSCCCPLQLSSLVHLNTSLERSVEPPLVSKRKFFRGLIMPKSPTSTSRETTRSPARRFAACSLLVSCPPGTMVSSYRRSSLSLLAATCSGCLFGKAARHTLLVSCPSGVCLNRSLLRAMSRQVPCCHCSAVSLERQAAICIRSRCLTRLVFASECGFITSSIFVTGKVNCSRKSKGEHLFDLLHAAGHLCKLSTDSVCGFSTSSALVSHIHLRPHNGPRVNRSWSAAPGNACGR